MTAVSARPALHELGAGEIAAAIRSGDLSPVTLAEALLERIAALDPKLQAFSYLKPDAVLAEASVLAAEAKAGKFRGPLHGVPFGIKEQFTLAGIPTRGDWSDPNPPLGQYDATVVTRLKASGALLMGKLYMVGPAGTPPTHNPWNLEHTPGGSSSGSGAAVGARFVPIAMSEQTGGSGIRPAAYCGVSGLKPTYGRNSRRGMFAMAWSHDHACIIGTTIADVARTFSVTGGFDPLDPTSVFGPVGEMNLAPATIRPPRIGVVRNFFPEQTQPEMQAAIEAAAAQLKAAGADVTDMMLPAEFEMSWPNWALMGAAEGAAINARGEAERARLGIPAPTPPAHPKGINKFSALAKGIGDIIPATYYLHAQRMRRYLRDLADVTLSGYDAILMATAPGAAPKGLAGSGDWSLLAPWSHLGQPAISIPGGLDSAGMPLGLQLVGATMTDEKLLETGVWCEEVIGRLPTPTF